MRLRTLIGFGALLLLTAACSAGSGSSIDVSEALDPKTEPVMVTLTVDQGKAASARIGPDGGTLAATGADGSHYLLEIPAGALVEDVDIRMTPILSMEGLPLPEGLAAGVQLEPEGMTFYDVVSLTIEPADVVPVERQLPVGTSGQTGALYIPLIDPDPNAIRLRLRHFSSAGLATGLTADLEPVRQRLGGDIETRLASLANAEIAHARQAGEGNPNANAELMAALEYLDQQYVEHVIKPRIAAAGESCASGQLAIQTVLSYGRRRQLLGMVENSTQEMISLVPTMTRVCLREEYELCRDEHIVHRMLPSLVGLDRQRQLMGIVSAEMDQIIAEGEDLTRKCLRFELEFESSAEMSSGDMEVASEVKSKVTVQYEGELAPPEGSSALDNTNFEFVLPSGGCTANPVPGGGTFTVISLNWDVLYNSPGGESQVATEIDQVGHVKDILLRFDPGQTTETVKLSCPFGRTMPDMGVSGWWSRFFFGSHAEEAANVDPSTTSGFDPMDPSTLMDVTYLATGWEVSGDELFAEREWEKAIAGITEEGTFKLYHRPQ